MPTAKRLFLPEALCAETEVTPATEWVIDDADAVKHLVQVQRLKPGQPVIAVNAPHRVAYSCTVIDVRKQAFTLGQITPVPEAPQAPLPLVTLYVGLLKEQAWDVVLQKSCELGVHRIVPLWAAYSTISQKQVNGARLERWQRILKEAALQCEAFTWPELAVPQSVAHALKGCPTTEFGVLLLERQADIPTVTGVVQSSGHQALGLWVGPEGGWSPEEAIALQKQLQPASLGARILRAETACIAGLTLLLHGKQ
jgi:16S rRNA (uracil1498-N3)-methyltransferase